MKIWTAGLSVLLFAMASCSTDKLVDPRLVRTIGVKIEMGVIKVAEDPAPANITQNVIKWELDQATFNAGYRFPEGGIAKEVKAAKPPASCVLIGDFAYAFHNCGPKQQGKEFHCNRVNRVFEPGACYKYTVTLTGSPAIQPLDPWIQNN